MLGRMCSLVCIEDEEFQNFHIPSCTENTEIWAQIILLHSVILGCFGGVYAMICCFTPDFIILLVS